MTGNGSIANSHLPNGQSLIRRQTNGFNGTPNATNGLSNGSINLVAQHVIVNNNNMINGNNNNNGNSQPQQQQQQQQGTPIQQQQMPIKAISWNYSIDVWWDKVMAEASNECEPVWVDAEDPLFILYTR